LTRSLHRCAGEDVAGGFEPILTLPGFDLPRRCCRTQYVGRHSHQKPRRYHRAARSPRSIRTVRDPAERPAGVHATDHYTVPADGSRAHQGA
jgi:hypothetical protein